MKTSAIILAAGSGKRMGKTLAKQYLPLGDKPILAHTLLTFQDCSAINEICTVVSKQEVDFVREEIIQKYGITKCAQIVAGGKERQDSVRNALLTTKNAEMVIIHDGVRPFVSNELILRCIASAQEFGACALGVPLKDTIKEVDSDGLVISTPRRESFWQIQTPQAFSSEIIVQAYEMAFAQNVYATDDCALVERLGRKVMIIHGNYRNIKITTAEDLLYANALMEEGKC